MITKLSDNNRKLALIVLSGMLLAGIVFSVVQITKAGPTGPHNPGHIWANLDKPNNCSTNQVVYGADDSGWLCEAVVTGVTGGFGLSGGGSGSPTLDVNMGPGISIQNDAVALAFPSKSCISGQAIQSFDLSSFNQPTCVSVGGGGGTLACTGNSNSCISTTFCSTQCPSGYTLTGCAGGVTESSATTWYTQPIYGINTCYVWSAGNRNLVVYAMCCKIQ